MKKSVLTLLTAAVLACGCTQEAKETTQTAPPHLEKRGNTTQLIVQGEPWLALGCELGNSTSSSRDYLLPYWQKLKDAGVNTVLAVVSWEQTEPSEGQFDFTVVDNLQADARANNMKLVRLKSVADG